MDAANVSRARAASLAEATASAASFALYRLEDGPEEVSLVTILMVERGPRHARPWRPDPPARYPCNPSKQIDLSQL